MDELSKTIVHQATTLRIYAEKIAQQEQVIQALQQALQAQQQSAPQPAAPAAEEPAA